MAIPNRTVANDNDKARNTEGESLFNFKTRVGLLLSMLLSCASFATDHGPNIKRYLPSMKDARMEQFKQSVEDRTGGLVLRMGYVVGADGKPLRNDDGKEVIEVRIYKDGVAGDYTFLLQP
ncbi:hypothetical protein OAS86_04270 [Gammaproteobacteria bacterium]|nr:hypothetical protein [Gammaproteobacteria bacterium]